MKLLTARQASRKFGVPAKRIRDWSASKDEFGNRKLPSPGKNRKGSHLYDESLIAQLIGHPGAAG